MLHSSRDTFPNCSSAAFIIVHHIRFNNIAKFSKASIVLYPSIISFSLSVIGVELDISSIVCSTLLLW